MRRSTAPSLLVCSNQNARGSALSRASSSRPNTRASQSVSKWNVSDSTCIENFFSRRVSKKQKSARAAATPHSASSAAAASTTCHVCPSANARSRIAGASAYSASRSA